MQFNINYFLLLKYRYVAVFTGDKKIVGHSYHLIMKFKVDWLIKDEKKKKKLRSFRYFLTLSCLNYGI